MKKYFILTIGLSAALAFTSCKSSVTAQDVLGQQEKAEKALTNAQEEAIELAQMKEQFSVDNVKAQSKKLKGEKSKIDKDIKKLEGVTTDAATGATEGLVADLKNKSKSISQKIESLGKQPKENWAKAIETINQNILSLEQQVAQITANINKPSE